MPPKCQPTPRFSYPFPPCFQHPLINSYNDSSRIFYTRSEDTPSDFQDSSWSSSLPSPQQWHDDSIHNTQHWTEKPSTTPPTGSKLRTIWSLPIASSPLLDNEPSSFGPDSSANSSPLVRPAPQNEDAFQFLFAETIVPKSLAAPDLLSDLAGLKFTEEPVLEREKVTTFVGESPPVFPCPAPCDTDEWGPFPASQDDMLTAAVVGFMNSPEHNPFQGSIPMERVQNFAKKTSYYQSVVGGVTSHDWRVYIDSHPKEFQFFESQNRKGRVYLVAHTRWYDGDLREAALRTQRERHIVECLLSYLEHVWTCKVDEFIERYPTLPRNQVTPGKEQIPLPIRGDLVRLIRRRPHFFSYNTDTYEVSLNTRGNYHGDNHAPRFDEVW